MQFAAALYEARGDSVEHTLLSMTQQRMFGILAGDVEPRQQLEPVVHAPERIAFLPTVRPQAP